MKITVAELKKFLKTEAKKLQSDWNDVPKWVIDSSVRFFNEKSVESIEDKLGEYVSEDSEHYPKIIKALKKALKKNPDMMADEVEFDAGNDNEVRMETLTMWQPLEFTLTVKQLCETLGID
jgi:molybdopterin converting factor small subunit